MRCRLIEQSISDKSVPLVAMAWDLGDRGDSSVAGRPYGCLTAGLQGGLYSYCSQCLFEVADGPYSWCLYQV